MNLRRFFRITDDYSFSKRGSNHYVALEDGQPKYDIHNNNGKWKCSCTGFKYRGNCKHVAMLTEQLNEPVQERLPQHLARVRALEKSLKLWEERLATDPTNTSLQKQVAAKKALLTEARQKADEIEALPKPTRHPRSEFGGALPNIDRLFEGLGKYEIVGSWRRGKSTYKDVDILTIMSPSNWESLKKRLTQDPNFGPAPGHIHADVGDEVIRGGYRNGDRVEYLDINKVKDPENYGAWLLFRTGDAQFNMAARGWLKKFGCSLNEHGIKTSEGEVVTLPSEEAFFDWIGIPFIKPEDREGAKKFYEEVRKLPNGPVGLKSI